MTWQEEVLALDEIKQLYEKLYGWTKRGERIDLTSSSGDDVEKYNRRVRLDKERTDLTQRLQCN